MNGAKNFLMGLATGQTQPRDKAINTVVENRVVDTVEAFDTGDWETGIKDGGKWYIVQTYANEAQAVKGHAKWVSRALAITEKRLHKLNDVHSEEWWI